MARARALLLLALRRRARRRRSPPPRRADPPPMLGFSAERAAGAARARGASSTPPSTASEIGEWIRVLLGAARTTSARRTARRTPSASPRCSASGATRRRSRSSRCSSPPPRSGGSSWWRRRASRPRSTRIALPEDPTSGQRAEQLPTYNAYSIDGDVTGELVYVNYGVPADYEELAKRGIDVKGKIVDRPLRRLVARHQAEGGGRARRRRLHHLLATPREDGYFAGRRLSQGRLAAGAGRAARLGGRHAVPPRRSADARGRRRRRAPSGSTAARRATLTRIPVLPISARDAQPLLAAMGGPVAPRGVARRAAARLPPRAGAGEGAPASSPSTGSCGRSTTSSPSCPAASCPTSG